MPALSLVLTAAVLPIAALAGAPSGSPLDRAVQRALSGDAKTAAAGVAELRAAGPDALPALAAAISDDAVLDRVCGQHDCRSTLLFWHTDLEAAKARAAAEGKPILSLRLLGRLDEELSCANSRFFRTTLYPDRRVRELLADHFVLHWQTVRPVPKVTIDFGDGRTLERTLTGNSIHYVLDAEGRVLDAIPGLHGAKAFAAALGRDAALARKTAELDDERREAALRAFHGERIAGIRAAWAADLAALGVAPSRRGAKPSFEDLERASESRWPEIAERHLQGFDIEVRSVARPFTVPSAWDAGRIAVTKAVVEDPMLRQFDVLQRSIALDEVTNEYQLHRRLHEWLEAGSAPRDLDMLNERVYRELFLMPLDDPWLGLSPRDSFSAITNDGRRGP